MGFPRGTRINHPQSRAGTFCACSLGLGAQAGTKSEAQCSCLTSFLLFFPPPQKQLMVIGMDVSHGRGTRSVIGFVASINQYAVPSPLSPLFLPWGAPVVPNPLAPARAGEKKAPWPRAGLGGGTTAPDFGSLPAGS